MPPAGEIPPLRDPRRAGDGPNGPFGSPGDSAMSRAEKFDDEKKRIIQHCFGKKDKDGTCMWLLPFCCSRLFTAALAIVPLLRRTVLRCAEPCSKPWSLAVIALCLISLLVNLIFKPLMVLLSSY